MMPERSTTTTDISMDKAGAAPARNGGSKTP
jgi:hypothetical protein